MNLEKKLYKISELLLSKYGNEEPKFSLMTGRSGITLFLAYFWKASGIELVRKQIIEEAELLKSSLDTTNLRLSDGLSGQIWALGQVEHLIDVDFGIKTIAKDLIKQLNDHAEFIKHSNQLDLLHGLLGIELCLSGFDGGQISTNLDNAFLNHCIKDDYGAFWYESLGKKSIINLGLAHGHAAHLCYLADRINSVNCSVKTQFKELIQQGIGFLESNKLTNSLSQFPSFKDEGSNNPSRLAWCYGDLGIGISYLRCAESIKDEALSKRGLEILKRTTNRLSEDQSGVQDLGFCHGSSGLCHIYDYLYRITSDETFLKCSAHWLQYTIERLFEKENTYRAYRGPEEGWIESMGLLDGLAGIGLVILNKVFPNLSKWEEIFYLKPIHDGKN